MELLLKSADGEGGVFELSFGVVAVLFDSLFFFAEPMIEGPHFTARSVLKCSGESCATKSQTCRQYRLGNSISNSYQYC